MVLKPRRVNVCSSCWLAMVSSVHRERAPCRGHKGTLARTSARTCIKYRWRRKLKRSIRELLSPRLPINAAEKEGLVSGSGTGVLPRTPVSGARDFPEPLADKAGKSGSLQQWVPGYDRKRTRLCQFRLLRPYVS